MLLTPASLMWESWRGSRLSADELQDLRDRRLRRVIRHAVASVPYYRSLFASAGLTPEDIRTTADLKRVPASGKDDLVAAGIENVVAQGTDLDACTVRRTSGASGRPFSTYLDGREWWTRRLLGLRRLAGAGLRPWDRVCVVCDPTQLKAARFRTHCVSAISPAVEQVERLRQLRPTVLKAWPSSLRVLLHHARRPFIRPRIVALSGEECTEELRRSIESELGSEVFSFYGAGEVGPIASECRAHLGMHVNADQLVVECAGGSVEVTSLYGFTMPYIRYRLGDVASLQETPCPCGSPFPRLVSLRGRTDDLIRLPDGRMLSVTGVVSAALRPFPTLRRFRLIQEAIDRLSLQAVFFEPPTPETISAMTRRMLECLGSGVALDIAVVDAVDQDGTRKFGNFVSRLSDPAVAAAGTRDPR